MVVYECPTCGKKLTCSSPDEATFRPFCSRRCKLVDLGKWLSEEYRVEEDLPPTPDPTNPQSLEPDEE